jgi:hypothetical protein
MAELFAYNLGSVVAPVLVALGICWLAGACLYGRKR